MLMLDLFIGTYANASIGERDVIYKAISLLLERPANENDLGKCSKFFRASNPNVYCLCYEKNAIGNVEFILREGQYLSMSIIFVPIFLLN